MRNSREVEFMAWHYEFKEIISWENLQQLSIPFVFGYGTLNLMEYTGLKDVRGIKIHEDQIVKAKGFNPSLYRVQFIEGGFCLTHPDVEGYPLDINIMYPSIGCQIEVVGNIWESPEWFKDKK